MSFKDYPVGELDGAAATAGTDTGAGTAGGGASSGSGGSSVSGAGSGGGGSSSSGASSGGGASEEGGAPPEGAAGTPEVSGSSNVIDDFEADDDAIAASDGREGAWYVVNDGNGNQTPRSGARLLPSAFEPARDGSSHAVHTSGGPFFGWGALIGAPLADGDGYDLSGFQGIRLWVRSGPGAPGGPGGPGGGAAKQVRLSLATPATKAGGPCMVCGDHFAADIPLTSQWQRAEVPFGTLKQSGFGGPAQELDLHEVTDIQLSFPGGVAFDLWVDDIELY